MLFAGDLAFNGGQPFVLEGSIARLPPGHRADARARRPRCCCPATARSAAATTWRRCSARWTTTSAYVEDVAAESYAAGLTPLEAAQKHRDNPYSRPGPRPSGSSATCTAPTPSWPATRPTPTPHRPLGLARHGHLPRRPDRLPRLIAGLLQKHRSVRATPAHRVSGSRTARALWRTDRLVRAALRSGASPGPPRWSPREHHLGDAAGRHGDLERERSRPRVPGRPRPAVRRHVLGRGPGDPATGPRLDAEPRARSAPARCSPATYRCRNEIDRALGVVVERLVRHAVVVDAVPALPHRGRAAVDHRQPRRLGVLEQQLVGEVEVAVVGQHRAAGPASPGSRCRGASRPRAPASARSSAARRRCSSGTSPKRSARTRLACVCGRDPARRRRRTPCARRRRPRR